MCVAEKAGQNTLSLPSKHLHDLGRLQLGPRHEDFPQAEVEVQGLEPLLLEDRVLEVVRHDQTHADREGPKVPVPFPHLLGLRWLLRAFFRGSRGSSALFGREVSLLEQESPMFRCGDCILCMPALIKLVPAR